MAPIARMMMSMLCYYYEYMLAAGLSTPFPTRHSLLFLNYRYDVVPPLLKNSVMKQFDDSCSHCKWFGWMVVDQGGRCVLK